MANPGLPRDELTRTYQIWRATGDNVSETARRLHKSRAAIDRRLANCKKFGIDREVDRGPLLDFPDFPADDIPTEELIEFARKRNRQRKKHARFRKWFPVKINMDGPVGISFFGDPHVDDNGCDLDRLYEHCQIHRNTPGLFGINVGDTTNNWVGRLGRLFAEQDASQATARKMARWLLADSGVTWACWVLGNHDRWNDGDAILKGMNAGKVPMEDWQARISFRLPGGRECRVWTAHDFEGHSQWNSLHGPQKAAHKKNWAHIYACGHKHNWAMHQEESGSRDFVYWLVRAKGYKAIDSHAEYHGHDQQEDAGEAITAIINPDAKTETGFVQCFADMEAAADYLKVLRRKK